MQENDLLKKKNEKMLSMMKNFSEQPEINAEQFFTNLQQQKKNSKSQAQLLAELKSENLELQTEIFELKAKTKQL